MKKTNYITYFLFLIILISCKKEVKDNGEFTYTDDNITVDQIVNNYLAITNGDFSIGNGFTGSIGADLNTSNFQYLKTSHVIINGRKFPQNISYNYSTYQENRYLYPDIYNSTPSEQLQLQDYFANVNSQPKTDFQLYDTTGNRIISFITNNPKPFIASIENNFYYNSTSGSRIVLKWNPDANDKLGIAVVLSADNGTRYLNFSDAGGSIDLTDELFKSNTNGLDRIVVTVTRGVILVGKGKDGRTYKYTNRTNYNETVYI